MNGSTRWFLLGLATLAQSSVSAIRLGIPAVIPLIRDELDLDRSQVGLVSSLLNGGAAAAGVPAGKMTDRIGERRVIGFGAIASGVVVLLFHAVSGYLPLLVVLLVLGFLTSVAVPAGGALVNRWFGRHERAMAMGVRQTGVPLGGAAAALVLPPLALQLGWRTAMDVVGAVAVVVGLVTLWLYLDAGSQGARKAATAVLGVRELLAHRGISSLLLFAFLFGGSQWCVLTYLVLYLGEDLGLPLLQATPLLALAQVAGVTGRIGWGIVSDRLTGGRRVPVMAFIGVLGIGGTVALALAPRTLPIVGAALLAIVLGLTLLGWNGLPHVLAPELVGQHAAGVAVGLVNSVGFLGVLVFPPLFGLLVDLAGTYRVAWFALVALLLSALLALPMAYRAENAALSDHA